MWRYKNPFTMIGTIDRCWLFTFQTLEQCARKLLPRALEPVTFRGFAFWNVVVSHLHAMRPKPLPEILGISYWHVAYRLYVRMTSACGAEIEGLYFLRSDCDNNLIARAGNLLTDFHFHYAEIKLREQTASLDLAIASPDAPAEITLDQKSAAVLPAHSAFPSLAAASDFLKYKPHGISIISDDYANIIKIDPSNDQASLKLAELYDEQKLTMDARQQYQAVADSLESKGQIQLALKIMKQIANLEPSNIQLRSELAERYQKEGFPEDAHQTYLQTGQYLCDNGRTEESIAIFKKALEINPASKTAIALLLKIFTRDGGPEKAVETLADMMGKDQNDIELLTLVGRNYLNNKMPSAAETLFLRVFQQDAGQYEYLIEISRRHLEASQFDDAVRVLDLCLEKMIEQGQRKKATALLKEVLKRDAGHLGALERLIHIYKQSKELRALIATLKLFVKSAAAKGFHDEASQAMSKLMELEGEVTASSDSALDILNQREKTGENDEAKENTSGEYTAEILEAMVAKDPGSASAQLKMLEELVTSCPIFLPPRVKLKNLYLELGMNEKAAHQCRELARMYEQSGEKKIAAQLLAEAESLTPPPPPPPPPPVEISAPTPVESLSLDQISPMGMGFNAEMQAINEKMSLGAVEIDLINNSAINNYKAPEFTPEFAPEFASEQAAPSAANNGQFSQQILMDRNFDREWRRAVRYRLKFSLAILELYNFAEFQNTHGQEQAIECIKRVARAMMKELKRPGDELISYGSSQFGVVLPDTDREGALTVIERLRQAIRSAKIANTNGAPFTFACGVATCLPKRNKPAMAFIDEVYKNKR